VLYYQPLLPDAPSINADPMAVLWQLPVLMKETLREDPERLMRTDGNRRRWYVNTSGGSTGEPVRFMQDNQVSAYVVVTALRYHESLGRRLGERAVFLWGSQREVLGGSHSLKSRLLSAPQRRGRERLPADGGDDPAVPAANR
jgi:phenylacetate-CoA ligase